MKALNNRRHSVVENDFRVVRSLYTDESHLNEMADFYNHVSRFGSTPFEKVRNVLERKNKVIRVLDAGCGAGAFWNDIGKLDTIQSLLLYDQSSELVEYACGIARKVGIDNVQGIVADLEVTSSLWGIEVDVVLALQVYHHLQFVEDTHNHLRNSLGKNGLIIATTCSESHMYELYEQVALFFAVDYEQARGLKHFNEAHLVKLSGLIESEDVVGRIICSSSSVLKKYVYSLAILDRFNLRGSKATAEFLNFMGEWAETLISKKGGVEFHQSVRLALFEA